MTAEETIIKYLKEKLKEFELTGKYRADDFIEYLEEELK